MSTPERRPAVGSRTLKREKPGAPAPDYNSAATFAPERMQLTPQEKAWYVHAGNFYYDNAVAMAPRKRPVRKETLTRDTTFEGTFESDDMPILRRRLRQTYGRVLPDEEAAEMKTLGAAIDVTVRLAIESGREVPEPWVPPAKNP